MTAWIYPYETLFGDTEIHLDGLQVDGDVVPGSNIDADQREVRLVDLERAGWSETEMEIVLTGPHTELRKLAESGSRPAAVAIAHCSASNARQAVRLAPENGSASTWRGTLQLHRSAWFGRIELRGAIVATVEGVEDRVIGTASPWTIRLDDVPPPPATGAIDIVWQDFESPDEELSWLTAYKAEPAFLRLDDNQPVLYLNRGFEGLKALLDRKPSREPGEQALHDQTRAGLAAEVWAAMFNAAIQAIRQEEDDEDPDWPEEQWKRTALELLLERMYPDKASEEALRLVAERRLEPEGGGLLQQEMLTSVSKHVGAARLLRGAINELGKSLKEV